MAGDWIKMRVGLTNHPRVLRMAEQLLDDADFMAWAGFSVGLAGFPAPSAADQRAELHAALRVTRYVTVTALLKFWGYANEHAKAEKIAALWPEDVDEITGVPGFSQAMQVAGWAEFDLEKGGLTMPNFEEHNISATVRSTSAAERQKRYRERQKQPQSGDVTRDVTVTPREEKRREEKKEDKEGTPRKRAPVIARPDDVSEKTWADWQQLRKAKRAPVTDTVVDGARSESVKAGLSLEQFLAIWCRRGSQGLEAAWIRADDRGAGQRPAETAYQQSQRERVAEFAPGVAKRPGTSNVIEMEAGNVPVIASC